MFVSGVASFQLAFRFKTWKVDLDLEINFHVQFFWQMAFDKTNFVTFFSGVKYKQLFFDRALRKLYWRPFWTAI
jgi:hypothetical protein